MNEKLDLKSKDIIKNNIKYIEDRFPNSVKEGKIDFEALKQDLSDEIIDIKKEKYQLTWAGKVKSIKEANTQTNKTIRPVQEKSVYYNNTRNIYIEGDNLEALKILQESYLNKIKCIYIDPPYNTGNDFVYNDNFKKDERNELSESGQIDEYNNKLISNTESNGRFHSDWLSMIYPRLKLARNLLTDDGIIFISIDDNEQANLKRLCDEIFGEANFVAQIVVENDSRARPYNSISITHEYVLIYVKSTKAQIKMLQDPNKSFSYKDKDGGFDLYELRNRNTAFNIGNRPNLYYPFYLNENNKDENELYEISLEKKDGWIEVYPQESNQIKTVWRWGKEKASKNLNTILFGKKSSTGVWQIVKKYRGDTYVLNSVWTQKEFKSDRGTLEVKKLFDNNKVFDFPKPVDLIKRFIELFTDNDDLILDFFSGSATTAHAVMQLNAEDNENRHYILIQLPEKYTNELSKLTFETICDVGEERIRRAAKKIKEETNADIDYGFRVYKVDSSNMKDIYYEPSKLSQSQLNMFESNIKEDRTAEDLLTQVILDLGLTLDLKIEEKSILDNKVYYVADNSLIACFDDEVNINIINDICEVKPLKIIFRESSFKDDSEKINAFERVKKLSPETEINVI